MQQIVAQITAIPWGHTIAIITKCKRIEEALYYVNRTIEYNWSRSVLMHQIENRLFGREGKSITNFSMTLPQLQSDLAQQTLKDPYIFDFLCPMQVIYTKEYRGRGHYPKPLPEVVRKLQA